MIIPIRCFTCGKVIAPIYLKYLDLVAKEKKVDKKIYNISDIDGLSIEGKIMNDLNIKKICCRQVFLGHIELIDVIER